MQPRVGLGLSVLPNVGLTASGSGVFAENESVTWRAETALTYQFLDDSDLADDDNPGSGDWTQVFLGAKLMTHPADRQHWTVRGGAVWFNAEGEPNIVDDPGDYAGAFLGVGFETDLTGTLSMGPELAVMAAWGGDDDDLVLVPQLTWSVFWRL